MLRMPLDSWSLHLPLVSKAAFNLMEQTAAVMSDVTKAAFRLITAISRDVKEHQFEDGQLKALLSLASNDIDDPQRQVV